MSKFTKALEKLQQEKEKANRISAARNFSQEVPESLPHWESGILCLRNATPDRRVVSYHFPNSLITEQYRMLRTNLTTQFVNFPAKVILVSSSVRGEGKTVTATNLAYSLAEVREKKVALIDADLRRGKVGEYLGLGKDRLGLAELLSKDLSIKDVMVKNSVPNLFIIPRGAVPKNPSELVGSHKFSALIAELRNHFDYIIVDSPPIMSVADPSMLAREVDGLLMVVQSRGTPRNVVAQANLLFRQAGVKILGYVLTNVEYQSADYRNYYYQYYTSDEEGPFKSRMGLFFKKFRYQVDKVENDLNHWWDKRVNRKSKKKTSKTAKPTETSKETQKEQCADYL